MRNHIQILAVLSLFLLSFAGQAQEGEKNQKAIIKTQIYCDHCKQCETCGQNVQKGLLDIKGVKMMELDEKAMTITVYYDSRKTNLSAIREAIANLGYDADEVKANPAAYEKLGGCCKKS